MLPAMTKTVITLACVLAAGLSAGATDADLIFTGGDVVTINSRQPEAAALAIRGGRIIAVGSPDDVLKLKGPATQVVDLQGRTLLPGFVAAHEHPAQVAVSNLLCIDISPFTTPTADGVWKKIRDRVAAAKPGETLILRGWDPLLQAGLQNPTLRELDELAPRNPLIIWSNNGHQAFANTLAFTDAGITHTTPDPLGGKYVRDAADRLTGTVQEAPAITAVLDPVLKRLKPADAVHSLQATYRDLAAIGVTTVSDHAVVSMFVPLYEAAGKAPGAAVRVRLYLAGAPDGTALMPLNSGDFAQKAIGIKFWADGSPWVGNIGISRPYLNNDVTQKAMGLPRDYRGQMNYRTEDLQRLVDRYFAQGWQVSIHAEGDLAIEQVLDVFEAALRQSPRYDHRLRIEHACIMSDAQFRRAARLGISVTFFMTHVYYWGDVMKRDLFGAAIAERWAACRSAQNAGVRFSLHNDSAASPVKPLLNIQTALTRKTRSGDVLGAAERVDIDAALRAQTLDPAYQLFVDQEVGSLEIGKLADVIVLSKDPRKVEPDKVGAIKVEATYLAGKKVWPGN